MTVLNLGVGQVLRYSCTGIKHDYLAIETITYDQLQDLYSDCFHKMKIKNKTRVPVFIVR